MPEERESMDIMDQLQILQSVSLDGESGQDEKVDALWRQLMAYKSFGDSDLSDAKARRAQAEASREQAQMEAIRTTQLLCAKIKSDAELELQEASRVRAQSEKTRQEAEEHLAKSKERREQVDNERGQIIADAQKKAQAIIEGASDIAKRETSELRRHALKEIRTVLNRVDSMKATVDEEMETQRILTNISKIKATSRWMLDDPDEKVNEVASSSNEQRQAVSSRRTAKPRRSAK